VNPMPRWPLRRSVQAAVRMHWPILLVLTVFVSLAVLYSVAVPIFEAPDEPKHFIYALSLARGEGLPVLDYSQEANESHQPPLYYGLVALPLRLLGLSGVQPDLTPNPYAAISSVSSPANKNAYLHTTSESWPYRGLALAVHTARVVSIGLGLLTVLATYGISLHLFSCHEERRWLATAAAATLAFTPQFVFISASVSNDNATTALCALCLWVAMTYAEGQRDSMRLLILGVICGMAVLTKLTALATLPLCLSGLVVQAWRGRHRAYPLAWRSLLADFATLYTPVLLVGGWWYVRNAILYGDPLLARYMELWLSGANASHQPIELLHRFLEARISYFGTFGWLNITWPEWVYRMLSLGSCLALVGLGAGAARMLSTRSQNIPRACWSLLAIWLVLALTTLGRWVLIAGGLQGRLLFPVAPALAGLAVAGWCGLVPRRIQALAQLPSVIVLFSLALATPLATIAPAYAPPPVHSLVPADVHPAQVDFGAFARLVGYEAHDDDLHPGQVAHLTLYWQVLSQPDADYTVFVHLLGRRGEAAGAIDTYPGKGSLPTSQWRPGMLIADTYPVPISQAASAPTRLLVCIGWYDHERHGISVPATDPAGNRVISVGYLKLTPRLWPKPPQVGPTANFAGIIRARSIEIEHRDTSVELGIVWECLQAPHQDLTLFVHLLGSAGDIRSQVDVQPLDGDYPTSLWERGEIIEDHISLPLPRDAAVESCSLRLGWYHLADGQRLRLLDNAGTNAGDALDLALPPLAR